MVIKFVKETEDDMSGISRSIGQPWDIRSNKDEILEGNIEEIRNEYDLDDLSQIVEQQEEHKPEADYDNREHDLNDLPQPQENSEDNESEGQNNSDDDSQEDDSNSQNKVSNIQS